MFLERFHMVDRLISLDTAAGRAEAESRIPDTSQVFEGHFPGHPILPGVLMIETMAQTGGWLVMAMLGFARMAFLAQVKEAKMRRFLGPGAAMNVTANLVHDGSGYAVVEGSIKEGGRAVADAEITYRILPFPNDAIYNGVIAMARHVGVPDALIGERDS
jgi:3-hydroxyacyl-[acyl-carrier-protein] dehydratase